MSDQHSMPFKSAGAEASTEDDSNTQTSTQNDTQDQKGTSTSSAPQSTRNGRGSQSTDNSLGGFIGLVATPLCLVAGVAVAALGGPIALVIGLSVAALAALGGGITALVKKNKKKNSRGGGNSRSPQSDGGQNRTSGAGGNRTGGASNTRDKNSGNRTGSASNGSRGPGAGNGTNRNSKNGSPNGSPNTRDGSNKNNKGGNDRSGSKNPFARNKNGDSAGDGKSKNNNTGGGSGGGNKKNPEDGKSKNNNTGGGSGGGKSNTGNSWNPFTRKNTSAGGGNSRTGGEPGSKSGARTGGLNAWNPLKRKEEGDKRKNRETRTCGTTEEDKKERERKQKEKKDKHNRKRASGDLMRQRLGRQLADSLKSKDDKENTENEEKRNEKNTEGSAQSRTKTTGHTPASATRTKAKDPPKSSKPSDTRTNTSGERATMSTPKRKQTRGGNTASAGSVVGIQSAGGTIRDSTVSINGDKVDVGNPGKDSVNSRLASKVRAQQRSSVQSQYEPSGEDRDGSVTLDDGTVIDAAGFPQYAVRSSGTAEDALGADYTPPHHRGGHTMSATKTKASSGSAKTANTVDAALRADRGREQEILQRGVTTLSQQRDEAERQSLWHSEQSSDDTDGEQAESHAQQAHAWEQERIYADQKVQEYLSRLNEH